MRRFGLIGRPLGHSASAAYFMEKFNREGVTDCEYSLYELGSIGDLPGLLERLPELCGLNVTILYTYDDLPCEAVESSRLIVNASPVGTYPNVDAAPRIPYAYVTPEHYLLDLVYNPPLTQFLDYGRQRGAHILNGRTMFVGQAEASWRIWNA